MPCIETGTDTLDQRLMYLSSKTIILLFFKILLAVLLSRAPPAKWQRRCISLSSNELPKLKVHSFTSKAELTLQNGTWLLLRLC